MVYGWVFSQTDGSRITPGMFMGESDRSVGPRTDRGLGSGWEDDAGMNIFSAVWIFVNYWG